MSERDYISWSEINTWLNCQLQWSFHYRDQIPQGSPNIDLQMGSAAHKILQVHFTTWPQSRSEAALHDAADKETTGLVLGDEDTMDRGAQLHGYAKTIWKVWGHDHDIPALTTETTIRIPLPWNLDKAYLCIPDALHVNTNERWGIIMSHKTRLSALPDLKILTLFHQQARLEAWAFRRKYGLDTVFIYFNALTPTKAEREGPLLYTAREDEATESMLRDMTAQVGHNPSIYRSGPHCYNCEYRTLHEALAAPGTNADVVKADFRRSKIDPLTT